MKYLIFAALTTLAACAHVEKGVVFFNESKGPQISLAPKDDGKVATVSLSLDLMGKRPQNSSIGSGLERTRELRETYGFYERR